MRSTVIFITTCAAFVLCAISQAEADSRFRDRCGNGLAVRCGTHGNPAGRKVTPGDYRGSPKDCCKDRFPTRCDSCRDQRRHSVKEGAHCAQKESPREKAVICRSNSKGYVACIVLEKGKEPRLTIGAPCGR